MQIEGLIPAIVQDVHTGRVLMLAYVNQKSYDFMLKHGETCFWSRSRGALWHKGATSGNVQKIHAMAFDCDGDTLLIQVEQTGTGACHTGSFSCFGAETGAFYALERVYDQIAARQANPQEKSYTNYLLAQGLDKICKKVGEEATEVVLAAKNNDAAELASEITDLAYHLLVLMFTHGLTVQHLQAELNARHQVKGNLKTANERGEF
ncbi:MAG: bifunctional phosphoribosyl-AMP cyclohydrolase/phosphoribosyl-ATP diphosphatase HisIE [Oscillospiraceae bacterium]|nr:bifunctional phosphoribosyl-AMP cyclohydrolase/phosphoribosyl-ATP diphosphatase HisIE [Oscillospiraceae bacterium]